MNRPSTKDLAPDASPQDDAARAGWLYYVGGLTQDQIAQEMGVSRQRAQRLVAKAKDEGLIHIRLEHPLASCLALEAALARRYGLLRCRVAPGLPGGDSALSTAGAAAALLETYLAEPRGLTIAFGTGRSLSAMAAALTTQKVERHRIVSLIGNIGEDGAATFYDVVPRIADKLHAPYYPMLVPVVSASAEERALFRDLQPVRRAYELATTADVTFVGVGQMGSDAPLLLDGFASGDDLRALTSLGAVGEIVGCMYDREGRYIEGAPTQARGGVRIDAGRKSPVIGVAAGTSKVPAIRAALKGRILNGLVTDEPTAVALLG
jgi:DNA-binding transcriptional regulator LsrR (DeoR family)